MYVVREPGCDTEVAGVETGLVAPEDVYWMKDRTCDTEAAELEGKLVSRADMTVAVVFVVSLAMVVALEEDENV